MRRLTIGAYTWNGFRSSKPLTAQPLRIDILIEPLMNELVDRHHRVASN
jgi:hypothetical protein